MSRRLLASLVFAASFLLDASGGEFGEYPCHTSMPPLPTDPAGYENMWDPFVLRAPDTGDPLEVRSESTDGVRLLSGFDRLPWNGRQIARDASGNWFVVIEQDGRKILLATGSGQSANPYRPRGGDLATMELVGSEGKAVFPGQREASRASMTIDGDNHLHVVWHNDGGLWHVKAELRDGAPVHLREKGAWTEPRRLAEGPCRHGDIMRNADGDAVVSYSVADTVYYRPVSGGEPEAAGGLGADMPEMKRPGGKIRMSERESQDSVMDLASDGSVYLAFRRDFAVWVARRTAAGEWLPAERVAREYAFHPSIMVVRGRPLVTFLHEGLRRIPLDLGEAVGKRAGGGPNIGYATLAENGWCTGAIVCAEEIPVYRRGMWSKRGRGHVFSKIEQLGWPVMFRDRHGVVWALWQNATRRWAYSARWMGEEFGQVQECRGPFNAPALPVNAEKHAPADAGDVGVLFYAAAGGGNDRAIFDRLRIPSLSVAEDREVLFLDSLEVGETAGVEFALNQMTKPSKEPALSPRGDNRVVWGASVSKRGDTYVMGYSSPLEDGSSRRGVAVSRDGVHFEKVDRLPEDLPEAGESSSRPLEFWKGSPGSKPPPYYENPDASDPRKKYVRLGFSTEDRGKYWVEYSSDGTTWAERVETTATEAMRERGRPSFFDPMDPERPIRIYSRVYTETGRSWGVIWTRDLVNWAGMEHLLDVDDPYGKTPAQSGIGSTGKNYTMRGQVYLDSVAGKGENEIYASSPRLAEGLYFCFYWPGVPGRPLADVGVAVSRDGFNFTRVKNGERTLPLGPPGAWDSGYIFQMSPMVDGDIVRVYYRGTAGHREGTDGYGHNLTEIGLATIRVNGWTYYTPDAHGALGTVTTIPIQAPAGVRRGLTVNVGGVAGRAGAFAGEVLDAATGKPIPGFGVAECIGPASDGLAVPVTWRGGDMLPAGRDIRLRFHLRAPRTRLYSFGFRTEPPLHPNERDTAPGG